MNKNKFERKRYKQKRKCKVSDHSKWPEKAPLNPPIFTYSRFEKALKDKLIQKSSAKMSEEACLIKMFKYFDVMNAGAVDFNQFARVLEKSGMYYPEE